MATKRDKLDHLIDGLRFRFDYATVNHYQPLPWEKPGLALRGEGTVSRWEMMRPMIDRLDCETAADIGCCTGWFVKQLADMGIPTVGVEGYGPYHRTASYALRKARASNTVILPLMVDEETVRLLPAADCYIVLAFWHHVVRQRGLLAAGAVLEGLWHRTGRVMFFETGESQEMGEEFGLPDMGDAPQMWLDDYLTEMCQGGVVQHLGRNRSGDFTRNLFAVVRDG